MPKGGELSERQAAVHRIVHLAALHCACARTLCTGIFHDLADVHILEGRCSHCIIGRGAARRLPPNYSLPSAAVVTEKLRRCSRLLESVVALFLDFRWLLSSNSPVRISRRMIIFLYSLFLKGRVVFAKHAAHK